MSVYGRLRRLPPPPRERVRRSARRARDWAPARVLGLRHVDRGQSAPEYAGVIVVVSLIITALVGAGISTDLGQGLASKVCDVVGTSCGSDADGGSDGGGGGADGGGTGAGTGGPQAAADNGGQSPASRKYRQAQQDLRDAQSDLNASEEKAKEAAEELGKILAEELGITDAFECVTEGDASSCTQTAINVLTSLVGGAVGKLAAKYGAPWKWKKAYKLVKAVKNNGGKLATGLKGIVKGKKSVSRAEGALDKARKACSHSFVPGTPVLLADGQRVAIEDVRPGQQVLATDPQRGVTHAQPVADTVTTKTDREFTRLTVATAGNSGTSTVDATDSHPFWVANQGRWVDAGKIRVGALLRTPSGGTLRVVGVHGYERQQRTHDLSVRGTHSYYVGAGLANALVHNASCRFGQPLKKGVFGKSKEKLDKRLRKVTDFYDMHGRPPAGTRQGGPKKAPGKYKNKNGRLPKREDGYYTESDVWPSHSGTADRGKERMIFGRNGEVYYTSDHYENFLRLR